MNSDVLHTTSVAILLSTRNGEAFLRQQLDSFLHQTYAGWTLYWRDDASEDNTARVVADFAAAAGDGRVVAVRDVSARLGISGSFLTLLRAVMACDSPPFIAFADQDDVWLPEKLARGIAALADVPEQEPALYCARQVLVNAELQQIGLSRRPRRRPGFPAALTQNIATGCTVMVNRAAAELIARSRAPGATLHDWWCYLVVAAGGGHILIDDAPVVLYRQHSANAVGSPGSTAKRAFAALRRGPGMFMALLRAHTAALRVQPALLSAEAVSLVSAIDRALAAGPLRRLACLMRVRGLRRQTWYETLLFRAWFLIG